MRGDVRCGNWKRATSFMDVRDRLPNGPSGPLSQLLGCSPNINEPFLTRDNGSLRTRINFISVGVLHGANSIWSAIYLLAGILNLRQKGDVGFILEVALVRGIYCGVTAALSRSCLVGLLREGRAPRFPTFVLFTPVPIFTLCFLPLSLLVKLSFELYRRTQWSAQVKCYCFCLSHTPFNPQRMFLVGENERFECFLQLNVIMDFFFFIFKMGTAACFHLHLGVCFVTITSLTDTAASVSHCYQSWRD